MSLPNNHNLSTSSDNTKSTHVYFASVKNSTSMKRSNNALEGGDDTGCKKLRYDMSPNTTWSISSTSTKANSKNVSSQYMKKDGLSKSVTLSCDSSDDNKKLITLNSTASSPKDEVIVIRNFDATDYSEISPTSPLQTNAGNDEYVLFSTDVVDYVDNNDCLPTNIKTSLNKEIPKSTSVTMDSISLNCSNSSMINKESHLSGSVDYKNLKNTKNSDLETSDSIELVLLPTLQESKLNMTKSETTTKTLVPRIATVPSNNLMRNHSVSTVTSNQAKSNVNQLFNRVNIHTALKNQPVVVSTKKLMSEVTQPTAKVSFGNTTISVPLLKPLNSTQRVQTSVTIGEAQKTMQSSMQQQTQLNMSKILNVKRGQKINQPTIVSLSQIKQIKPVTTAKIVQAKVVGKKLPLPVSIGTPVTSTNVATISTHTLLENADTSGESNIKIIGTTTNLQKTYPSDTKIAKSDDQVGGIKIEEKSDASAIIKSSLPQKSVNEIPPLVATLSKSVNQQHQFPNSLSSTMSIIRQSISSTSISTSAGCTTTFPIITSDSKTQTDGQSSIGSLNVNSGHKLSTTPVITIPRTISLMLAKNPINSSGKTVSGTSTIPTQIVTTIATDNLKKISISKANTVNILPVSSSTTNTPIPQLVDSTTKQEFTSISMQSYDVLPVSETSSSNSVSIKMPCVSTSVSQQTIKRSKSSDEVDRELNGSSLNLGATKRKSIESLTTKRQAGPEDNLTAGTTDNQTATLYNNATVKANFSVPITIASSTVISKSEETNNVLLKQLLQNSSAPHTTSQSATVNNCVSTSLPTACNQVISTRKVINVRAPSLGEVSSLEAQLARPVIPPVPANSSASQQLNVSSQLKSLKHNREVTTTEQNVEHDNATQHSDVKTKSSVQIISKETSFVSKPTVSSIEGHQRSKLNDNSTEAAPVESVGTLSSQIKVGSTNISPRPNIPLEKKKLVDNKVDVHDSNIQLNKVSCPTSIASDPTACTSIAQTNISLTNNEANGDKSVRFQSQSQNLVKPEHRGRLNEHLIKLNIPPNVQNITTLNVPFKITTKSSEEQSVTLSGLDVSQNSEKQKNDIETIKKDVNFPSSTVESSASTSVGHTLTDTVTPTLENATTTTQNVDNSKSSVKNAGCGPRKKRKREYQKQRQQLISTNNVVATNSVCNSTNLKKRPRKLSKMEEDYDNFIDNLIVNIRQMQPLQVLEPLLNRSFNIYNIYGKRNSTRTVQNKNSLDSQQQFLLGEYGSGYHPHVPTHYDPKTFTSLATKENLTSIQNNFYDQEFLPVLYKSEQYTLSRFVANMRDKNVDIEDVTHHQKDNFDGQKNTKWNTLSRIPFPGLILMNNVTTHCLGRMSPVLPLVEPFSLKIKHVIKPLKAVSVIGLKSIPKSGPAESHQVDSELLKNSENGVNNTVIISLPSSAACNIMGILKDLANLLHMPVPVTYKVLNDTIGPSDKQMSDMNACQRSVKYKNLQHILSGRRRMCRNCGVSINSLGIRISKTTIPTASVKHNENKFPSGNLYFCGRTCYTQFKWTNRRQSAFVATTNKSTSEYSRKTESNMKGTTDKSDKCDTERKCGLKYYNSKCFTPTLQPRHPNEKELVDVLFKMGVTISPYNARLDSPSGNSSQTIEDTRQCIFCNERGDGLSDGTSRLLNFNVDKWVHLNCALWSSDVYETISGGLMNFQAAFQAGLNQTCNVCHHVGATLKCFKHRCGATFHLPCAIREKCVFYKNKTIHCQNHASRLDKENELHSLTVQRRVYVERDENHQVAAVMHHSELSNLLRVGSLTFLSIGQLLPHQLDAFHNSNYIYPVGYKVVRFYWSMRRPHKRCRYVCSILESAGRPEFSIQVQEAMESDIEFRDATPKAVWQRVLEPIAALRKECDLVQLFPQFITGEDLFGLTEPAIVRIIESLPGVENLTNYRFKFGRNPLLELPLAINPSGAARTEPKQRQLLGWRKSHTQRTSNNLNQRLVTSVNTVVSGEVSCPYSKQFVHSKSSQYKKMKQEWRNNVFLARSKIQGLGLYSARDMEKHTMIIEYIGEVIRTEVSEIREKQYEARNRGIYMFRLDEERVVDATLSGGLARYINHSCNPNCVTEIMEVDRELRIIISAKRRISRGEELSYDYKFDLEDDEHKISCMCGAPNCRKWMN